jgi:hypothetical protein
LGSSVNPAELSMTIKGILGLVVAILVGFGYNQLDLNILVDQITNFILLAVQMFSLGAVIWGGLRKFIK